MSQPTQVASLTQYTKGKLELFADDPKHYAFSNLFEVANMSAPFERIALTKNMEYVTEVMKVDGDSPWFTAAHDEFALVMDGEIEFHFVKLDPTQAVPKEKLGAVHVEGHPKGPRMGKVRARRGHLVLLPTGAAYQACSIAPAVTILQTVAGDLTLERWADICATQQDLTA
jgi:hypothetical protein